MVKYVVKRIVLMFITLFIIMTICFVMIKLLPDPIIKSKLAEYKQELALREAWGYNKPILTQYGIFLKKYLQNGTGVIALESVQNSWMLPNILQ